jgi:hypothetical protein
MSLLTSMTLSLLIDVYMSAKPLRACGISAFQYVGCFAWTAPFVGLIAANIGFLLSLIRLKT